MSSSFRGSKLSRSPITKSGSFPSDRAIFPPPSAAMNKLAHARVLSNKLCVGALPLHNMRVFICVKKSLMIVFLQILREDKIYGNYGQMFKLKKNCFIQ